MPADKPRAQQNSWDMVLSIAPLVLIALVLAGSARACSVSPGGPTASPPPRIDASTVLTDAARAQSFPVRLPEVPQGWVPNSSSSVAVGAAESVRVGFITTDGRYLSLAQSDADATALVPEEVPGVSTDDATGTEQVGGRTWEVYSAGGSEPVWITDLGPVRLLVTGSGTTDEFAALAAATAKAAPLLAPS